MPYTDKPQEVLASINSHTSPERVYVLAGEEEYFTDKIEKKLVATYLTEDALDFNLSILYGMETSMGQIISACRRIPLASNYTVVVVREAQHLLRGGSKGEAEGDDDKGTSSSFNDLMGLFSHPVPTNILILEFKGKLPARTISFFKTVAKEALYVESKEVREYKLDGYIVPMALEHGLRLSAEGISAMVARVGTDIARIDSELAKLSLALSAEQRTRVGAQEVLMYTGQSREYTAFDLKNALARKEAARALMIAKYLGDDEKKNPIQMIIPVLFSYFSTLLIAFYAPAPRDEKAVMAWLGISNSYMVKDYMSGLRVYRGRKVADIITALRKADARSKGMYSTEGESIEILTDLVFMILN